MIGFLEEQSRHVMGIVHNAETRACSFPAVNVMIQTVRAYGQDRCSLIAAALSYYALLSVFPLMLFLLALAGVFLPADRVIRVVSGFFTAGLPFNTRILQDSLVEITRLRGALTLASAVGFCWSAAGVFDLIQLGINRAFRVQQPRPLWRQRIVSLGMVAVVSLLFGASFLFTTAIRVAIHYGWVVRHDLVVEVLSSASAFIVGILILGLLYKHIPYGAQHRWRDVWVGAILAAILWELARLVFAWYITGYALLNLVYGPVAAVIAIMLWGYLTAAIMLFGAELVAVKVGAREHEKVGNEWWAFTAP